MDYVAFFTIVGVIALGAMSPGPSFIVVARTALQGGPRAGRRAALGIGSASLVFSVLAVTGLGVVLTYAEWLFVVLKIAGGAYLVYLGARIWRSRGSAAVIEFGGARPLVGRPYTAAMLTHLSNPKTIVVYASVFASALPHHSSLATLLAVPVAVASVETAWYFLVGSLLATPGPQRAYARWTNTIDRVAGAFLGGLGTYFAIDGIRTAAQ